MSVSSWAYSLVHCKGSPTCCNTSAFLAPLSPSLALSPLPSLLSRAGEGGPGAGQCTELPECRRWAMICFWGVIAVLVNFQSSPIAILHPFGIMLTPAYAAVYPRSLAGTYTTSLFNSVYLLHVFKQNHWAKKTSLGIVFGFFFFFPPR